MQLLSGLVVNIFLKNQTRNFVFLIPWQIRMSVRAMKNPIVFKVLRDQTMFIMQIKNEAKSVKPKFPFLSFITLKFKNKLLLFNFLKYLIRHYWLPISQN